MKRRKSRPKKELLAFAKKLNETLPRSEAWFWDKWRAEAMDIPQDKPNAPKFGFIPDIYNRQHRYIIEIDGSVHDQEYVQQMDRHKEKIYRSGGYLVVRVKAYCDNSFNRCVQLIRERRLQVNVPWNKKLRRAQKLALQLKSSEQKALERAQRKEKNRKRGIDEIRAIHRERLANPTPADIAAIHKRVGKIKAERARLQAQVDAAKLRRQKKLRPPADG